MIAFCYPGQGSQEVGMGQAMATAVPAARAVFDAADEALGFSLSAICAEGPIERLTETEITQPALVTTSLACVAALREAGITADVHVGHSVGEYAALAGAGLADDVDAIRLVRARGEATAAAARRRPGAMAAILGLDDAVVVGLCAGIDGVWPANYNSPGQIVVSGTVDGVDSLIAAAEAAGARRAIKLKVSGGFHSPLSASAGDDLRPVLETVAFRHPSSRFFSTTTVRDEDEQTIAQLLIDQLGAPVRFTQSVHALRDEGVETFVEVGSGSVLSGLIRRIDRSLATLSVQAPDDIPRLRELLDA